MHFYWKKSSEKRGPASRYFSAATALGASLVMLVSFAAPASASQAQPSQRSSSISTSQQARSATPHTADTQSLHTWWQNNAIKNASTGVSNDAVRESPFYSTKVATTSDPDVTYDAFTYMSVPRNGNGKVGYSEQDGAEFAADAGMTMSWSSFEYSADAEVYVKLDTNQTITSADQVTIRPTNKAFKKTLLGDNTVRISVPYSQAGYRFSVEFNPELITAYNDNSGGSGKLTTNASSGQAVDTEPQNSMMIFAQPMLQGTQATATTPNTSASNVQQINPGDIKNLDTTIKAGVNTLYFGPGNYWMGSNYRADLPANITWIYLAPGAYVKGSFLFKTSAANMKVTGYGVLSGEQYVYEADANNGFNHIDPSQSNCNGSCLKMLQFTSTGNPQTLDLQGLTVANPPFNSFVMYGDEDGPFAMNVNNYQQVGAWYWQTDGLELYRGTTLNNSFFHSNDDTIKLYHSDVKVNNTVIWKGENGPVFQWGWSPRNVENVSVSNTDIIHNRMYWNDQKSNTCVFNASPSYTDTSATNTADTNQHLQNFSFTNTNVEGMVNCAIRFYALQNTKNITFNGLHIGAWSKINLSAQENFFKAFTNAKGDKVSIGNQTQQKEGVLFHNFTVGDTPILKAGNNWSSDELGRLDFDADLWNNWDATADDQPTGKAPTLTVAGLEDGETAQKRDIAVSGNSNAKTVTVCVNNGSEMPVTLVDGHFTTKLKLAQVSNTIRVSATGDNGVMTVRRYTVYAFGSLLGSLSDPAGDDNGPGSYVYPSDGAFNKSSFDLRAFAVYKDADSLRFVTRVEGSINNPWGGNGMSTQRLNIYLADTATSHSPTVTSELPGTNNFTLGAWKKAIVVDGRYSDARYGSGVYDAGSDPVKSADVSLNIIQGNTMVASVPSSALQGIDMSTIGYQVSLFSDAESSEGIGNVRPVYSKACWDGNGKTCTSDIHSYRFGGGLGVPTDEEAHDSVTTDSNAIDIFSGTQSQAQLMSLSKSRIVLPFIALHTSHADNSDSGQQHSPASSQSGNKHSDTSLATHRQPVSHLAHTGVSVGSVLAIALLLACAGGISYKIRQIQHKHHQQD